jgi:hypothetical protein
MGFCIDFDARRAQPLTNIVPNEFRIFADSATENNGLGGSKSGKMSANGQRGRAFPPLKSGTDEPLLLLKGC